MGEARGIGLVGALELVKDKATKKFFQPALAVAAQVAKRAEAHGVIVRPLGGDVIAVSPPLIIETNDIEEIVRCVGRALDETWAALQSAGEA